MQAKDDKGDLGKTAEREFTIKKHKKQNQGPAVKIELLYQDDGSVEFRLNAKDAEGDTISEKGYQYQIASGHQQQPTPNVGSWSNHIIRTGSLSPGDYRLFVRAKDNKF